MSKLKCNNCGSTQDVIEVHSPGIWARLCRKCCESPQKLKAFFRAAEAEKERRTSRGKEK